MKIAISEELYEQYRLVLKERFFSEDVSEHVEKLIVSELRKFCTPGYTMDFFTQCKSPQQLTLDISRLTSGESYQDHSVFQNEYLCIDIENFKRIVDYDGMTESDVILKELSQMLQSQYGKENVYRFGGDEFVVDLKNSVRAAPESPKKIKLKFSFVKVEGQRNQRKNQYVNRVILHHLDKGMSEAKTDGNEIFCLINTD